MRSRIVLSGAVDILCRIRMTCRSVAVVKSSAMLAKTQVVFPGGLGFVSVFSYCQGFRPLSSAIARGSVFVFSYYQGSVFVFSYYQGSVFVFSCCQGFRLCLQLLPGFRLCLQLTARGSVFVFSYYQGSVFVFSYCQGFCLTPACLLKPLNS